MIVLIYHFKLAIHTKCIEQIVCIYSVKVELVSVQWNSALQQKGITLPIPQPQKSTYPSTTEVHNDVQGSLFKTWYMWDIKCMEYQMYWIYFLHNLYSVQVEHVILPTPPLQKSTMMSPGRWIASTAVARFSSCWHFLWWRFFGRSTNVYNCPKKICSSEGEWRIFFYSFCLNVCCFTTFKESINWWIFTPQFVTYRSWIFMQPLNFI